MPTAFSRPDYSREELKSQKGQKRFLAEWKDDFSFEKVSFASRNVKKGDHLVFNRRLNKDFEVYKHHFLCIDVWYEENTPKIDIIEYTGPSTNLIGYLRLLFFDFTCLGEIKKRTYTYEELERKETLKVIWPDELERFTPEEVVTRAQSREGESYFDILKNNCENFITWSKSDLDVSTQVKDWYIKARDAVYSVCAGGINYINNKVVRRLVVKAAVAGLANVSDEIAVYLADVGTNAAFIVGGILELLLAAYQIKQAHNQYCDGVLIKSEKEFAVKTTQILAKGSCRFTGGCVGSVVGSAMGPVGSLVGGAIGAGIGHLVGCVVGYSIDYFTS